MKLTVGNVIRSAREKKDMSRAMLAKRLNITAGYLGHLEIGTHVYLSERLVGRLIEIMGPRMKVLKKMSDNQNRKARKYQAKYESK